MKYDNIYHRPSRKTESEISCEHWKIKYNKILNEARDINVLSGKYSE